MTRSTSSGTSATSAGAGDASGGIPGAVSPTRYVGWDHADQ
jgi:hypothetical protein